MLSGRVYLFVCVIEMGMDMHTCFMFAHTCDFKREEKKITYRHNTQIKHDNCMLLRTHCKMYLS